MKTIKLKREDTKIFNTIFIKIIDYITGELIYVDSIFLTNKDYSEKLNIDTLSINKSYVLKIESCYQNILFEKILEKYSIFNYNFYLYIEYIKNEIKLKIVSPKIFIFYKTNKYNYNDNYILDLYTKNKLDVLPSFNFNKCNNYTMFYTVDESINNFISDEYKVIILNHML